MESMSKTFEQKEHALNNKRKTTRRKDSIGNEQMLQIFHESVFKGRMWAT